MDHWFLRFFFLTDFLSFSFFLVLSPLLSLFSLSLFPVSFSRFHIVILQPFPHLFLSIINISDINIGKLKWRCVIIKSKIYRTAVKQNSVFGNARVISAWILSPCFIYTVIVTGGLARRGGRDFVLISPELLSFTDWKIGAFLIRSDWRTEVKQIVKFWLYIRRR